MVIRLNAQMDNVSVCLESMLRSWNTPAILLRNVPGSQHCFIHSSSTIATSGCDWNVGKRTDMEGLWRGSLIRTIDASTAKCCMRAWPDFLLTLDCHRILSRCCGPQKRKLECVALVSGLVAEPSDESIPARNPDRTFATSLTTIDIPSVIAFFADDTHSLYKYLPTYVCTHVAVQVLAMPLTITGSHAACSGRRRVPVLPRAKQPWVNA